MKVIIIGASTTGKTTILKKLAATMSQLPLQEADEVLTKLNGGTYPQDSQVKMTGLVPIMVQQILRSKQIIFFTNTDYFTIQDLTNVKNTGFTIILLNLPKANMLQRNKKRVLREGYDDLSQYFDSMIRYQESVINAGLIDKVINANQSIDNILSELQPYIYE